MKEKNKPSAAPVTSANGANFSDSDGNKRYSANTGKANPLGTNHLGTNASANAEYASSSSKSSDKSSINAESSAAFNTANNIISGGGSGGNGGGGEGGAPKTAKELRRAKLKKALRFKQKQLAFPYGIMVAVFVIVPLVIMFVAAFRGTDGSLTLGNFNKFWGQGEASANLWRTFFKTILLAFLTTVICLVLSYPLALALTKIKGNKRAIILLLFVAPMWINSLLRIYAVRLLFDNILDRGFAFVLVGMVYDFFPFMLLPLYTSLANMDNSLVEAAGDLGASPTTTLLKVKLPLSVPGMVSGAVMVFMPAMSTFAISSLLGGTTTLFGNLIEKKMVDALWGEGAAYSMVLLAVMAIIFFGANRLSRVKGSARGEGLL